MKSRSLQLLEKIEAGLVSPKKSSTSQAIMAAMVFDRHELYPFDWGNSTEKEKLDRLDAEQIDAIKQFKQERI